VEVSTRLLLPVIGGIVPPGVNDLLQELQPLRLLLMVCLGPGIDHVSQSGHRSSVGAVRLTMSGLISAEVAEQVQCTAESPISAVQ